MKAGDWERELSAYKEQFIKSQGWNEKQAANWIRDAWAYWHDGQLKISVARAKPLADPLPVFQFRTPAGWKLPPPLLLHVLEKFRLQGDGLVKSLTPRERVFSILAKQGSLQDQTKEPELKHSLALQATRDLEWVLDSDEFEKAGDTVWQAILAAIQFGRRQQLAEIYADEEAMEENMRGRLMTRKGKSAKGRKRPESPLREFRMRVQGLVREKLKLRQDAHTMRSLVVSCLHREGMVSKGANFVLKGVTARKDTVSKWVREEFKKLRA